MSNELTDVRCPCGAEFQADSYDAGFIAGSGMCQNCDAALPPKDICTCPSGDGSLRHPCPAHPAVEQACWDERKLSDLGNELHNLSCSIVHENEKLAEQIGGIARELWNWPQARAALAQPSPASDLDPFNLAPHAEAFNEAPDEALKPEQAEAERPIVSFEKYMQVMYDRDENAKRLDAALARVAELEAKLSDPTAVHQWQFSNAWFDGSEEVVLKAGKEGSPIRTLYAAPPSQAQHSVPEEFIGRLSEFLAQRGATGKALLRELRAMLAAAPGKEGV
ncbi:TPA: hypothetical protein L3869_001502 [Pseudomonas aeruginosa]|nr:hypothetical protein [Pseudomonas aeruginosa]